MHSDGDRTKKSFCFETKERGQIIPFLNMLYHELKTQMWLGIV